MTERPGGICDCYDPECGYPHGRNRIGKIGEMRAALSPRGFVPMYWQCYRCHDLGLSTCECLKRYPLVPPSPKSDGAK